MTLINCSRLLGKPILVLIALFAAVLPGQAFQLAADLSSATAAVPAAGGVLGVTKDPNGRGLSGVRVTAQSVIGKAERTVLSGSDGNFLIADLKPGRYQLIARSEGLATVAPATVDVTQNQVTYANVQLARAEGPAAPGETSIPEPARQSSVAAPVAELYVASELAAKKARIEQLEAEL